MSKFNEEFIKKHDEDSNKGYFFKVDKSIQKRYLVVIKIYYFYPNELKVEKVEKLICSIEDKEKCVIHIRALKQVLNYGLNLKKIHKVIHFNHILDGKGGGGRGGQKASPYQFFPCNTTNVGISPQNFLTLNFNPYDRLV